MTWNNGSIEKYDLLMLNLPVMLYYTAFSYLSIAREIRNGITTTNAAGGHCILAMNNNTSISLNYSRG